MAKSERRIAVLGATGFTGRLIAHDLAKQDVLLILAARNAGKLQALAKEVAAAETMVVDVRDAAALDALAQRAQVVINCVGPFVDYGEPVVRVEPQRSA